MKEIYELRFTIYELKGRMLVNRASYIVKQQV
jgi:hypothetical protein